MKPGGERDIHDEAHVHEAAEDDFGVAQDDEDIAESYLSFGCVPPEIGFQACFDVSSLILVQPLSSLWAGIPDVFSVSLAGTQEVL